MAAVADVAKGAMKAGGQTSTKNNLKHNISSIYNYIYISSIYNYIYIHHLYIYIIYI